MKSRYYEAELAYLREQGREFSRVFPSTAGLLAERSDDPDVERLLEGFAFLASRIRERVDDGMPELAQQLGAILVPQLTRYIPSCAIIQFQPDVRALRAATQIPRGAEVAGVAADGTRCRFQFTQVTDLLPLELLDVRAQKPTTRTEKLMLRFRAPPQGVQSVSETPIRLFLHGNVPFALTLRTWFLHHCVELAVFEGDTLRGKLTGPRRGRGFETVARLLPERPLEHDAFAAMAELLAFPHKYCFVDLPVLGSLATPEFELHFTFEAPPDLPHRVGKDDVRLHCAPIVNLFTTVSDPVRIEPLKPEALVRAADRFPTELEVYDVTEVVGTRQARRRRFPPFSSYGLGSTADVPHDEVYYVNRRVPAITDSGTDLYISLMTPRDAAPVAEPEVLSLELLCSNRGAAATLGIGSIDQPVRGSPVFVAFSNITAPTPPLYPHHDVELLWQLSSHVGLSRRGLQDAESLRRVLRAYNFAERGNPHQGRLASLWIEAIREVETRKLVRLHRGAPVTGTKTIVVLDETSFGGVGEAAVFGEALSEVFGRLVNLNSFDQLVARLSPSLREYTWAPRNGDLRLR
jgi:type VI secretion system protein ImpG